MFSAFAEKLYTNVSSSLYRKSVEQGILVPNEGYNYVANNRI
jgi:hypothetical protein